MTVPYYHDEKTGITLYCGDCRQVLRVLAAGSVDAVITDPPYGQSNESYDHGVDPCVWQDCFRVAKRNSFLLSFAGSPSYHRIASGIESAGWRVRQMWAWVYRDGLITSAWPKEGFDRLAPAFDPICFATKGKILLNIKRISGNSWKRPGRQSCGYSERSSGVKLLSANGNWPRNLLATENIPGFEYFVQSRTSPSLQRERVDHPNQKPLAVMQWLVDKTQPGDCILDPFCGSGTTLVAARDMGRRCIGVEVSEAFCAVAVQRLSQQVFAFGESP